VRFFGGLEVLWIQDPRVSMREKDSVFSHNRNYGRCLRRVSITGFAVLFIGGEVLGLKTVMFWF